MPTNAVPDVPIPDKLKSRPFDARGFVIPWFVDYIDGQPDFRTMDPRKFTQAITQKRCWICGGLLGVHKVFVVGPMCAISLTSSEPPSHRECALYATMACPFLSKPHAQRRIAGLPEGAQDGAGLGLNRNPAVALLWTTPDYTVFPAGAGGKGYLIRMGRPTQVEFYYDRRPATVAEIRASVQSGLPHLKTMAQLEGPAAEVAFEETIAAARRHFPAGVLS
jgi:hypothetical protein